VNAVAPAAVEQQQLMHTLALALHRPLLLRIPALVLRSLAGEMSDLFLISQRVVPQRITQSGFQFVYPKLPDALRDILLEPNPNRTDPCAAGVGVHGNEDFTG
jgi:NAD dependent epimerase/dehydratase family enzyme